MLGFLEVSCDHCMHKMFSNDHFYRLSIASIQPQDEVYVQLDKLRDQKIIQHTFNAPCGKGHKGTYFVFKHYVC